MMIPPNSLVFAIDDDSIGAEGSYSTAALGRVQE